MLNKQLEIREYLLKLSNYFAEYVRLEDILCETMLYAGDMTLSLIHI